MDNALDRLHAHLREKNIPFDDALERTYIDCPSHNSNSGSSLHATHEDGKVLLHCFAGCKTSDVLAAMDLEWHDLYDDRVPTKPANTSRAHDYRDAKGEVIGFATKQVDPDTGEKRSFIPLSRNPDTGRWQQKASDQLRTTLYRLPEFLAAVAEGREIALTEGEKDADTLWSLGIPATTNQGGAKNFTDAHARQFHGVHVTVYLDNDDAGLQRGAKLFPMLAQYAASLRVVRPVVSPPNGKDVTDHLDAGYTLADMVEVEPPAEMTEEPPPSTWALTDLRKVLADGYQRPQARIGVFGAAGGLFYEGSVNTIAGPSGKGKSWVVSAVIAEALNDGKRCLYIDHEADPGVVTYRLGTLGVSKDTMIRHLDYTNPSDPHYTAPDDWQRLLSTEYSVVVIDGVTNAMHSYGGSSNDQDVVSRWFNEIPVALARSTGAAVITVDHTSKVGANSGFAVGSQHKRAAVSGISYNLKAEVEMKPGQVGEIHLVIGKDRHGDVMRRAIEGKGDDQIGAILEFDATNEEALTVSRLGVLIASTDRTEKTRRGNIISKLELGPQAHADLVAGGNRNDMIELLDSMVAEGAINLEIRSRGKKFYSLPTRSVSIPPVSAPLKGCADDTGRIGSENPVVSTVSSENDVDTSHDTGRCPNPDCGSVLAEDADGWYCPEFCDESEAA